MDPKVAAPPVGSRARLVSGIVPILIGLCLAVTAAGLTWKAWDMFGPARRPMLQGWDDSFYYFWLPSVIIDHNLDYTRQVMHGGTIDSSARNAVLAQPRTATGLLPNKYPPGWAVGSLPFFLAARAVAPPGSTGFEPVYLLSVWLGQLIYAIVGLAFAVSMTRRLVPNGSAAVAVLVTWLASPLVYYQTVRLSLSHSQVFALAMTVFWLALRVSCGDRRRRVWFALGFCGALMVVTRNVAVVYLAFPAVLVLRHLRSWRGAVWLALGAAGPAAVQVAAWKMFFGSWIAYSYGGERFNFAQTHLGGVLFSPRHGWFYWHPLLLVGIVGFFGWVWRRPIAWAWVASLAAIIVLNAAWPTWWLASSFGNRGFEVATFFCMIGLAALFRGTADRPVLRAALAGVAGMAVVWNLVLLAVFLDHRIPTEEAVTYVDAAHAMVRWFAGVR
jgi:hypothetical protein